MIKRKNQIEEKKVSFSRLISTFTYTQHSTTLAFAFDSLAFSFEFNDPWLSEGKKHLIFSSHCSI